MTDLYSKKYFSRCIIYKELIKKGNKLRLKLNKIYLTYDPTLYQNNHILLEDIPTDLGYVGNFIDVDIDYEK